jgi:trimethylamine--corrinoid protein Co-methyltransferase
MIKARKYSSFPRYQIWTDEQIEQAHLASLSILEKTGIVINEPAALKLREDAGACVKGNLVKIPAVLVDSAIQSAPRRIVLYAKDGSSQLLLENGQVNYGMGADLPFTLDSYTRKIRSSVMKDAENAARVARRLDNIDWIASLSLASDVTIELADLYQMLALRKYNNKPNMTHSAGAQTMQGMIDMAAVLAGGYKALREKPTMAVYIQPVSPLTCGVESLKPLLLCAEYGVPVTYSSGMMMGGSGPVTLAALIALSNAECLTGLVIHQLKRPGSPFILGDVGGILDMKTTTMPYGGPEVTLMQVITGQLGHYYKLPTFGTAGFTDAFQLDAQAGMDAAYSLLFAALGDSSFVHDSGYMGVGISGSLEQLVLADETIGYVKRFMNGIEVNSDTLNVEVIKRVGPAGSYNDLKGTARDPKQNIWKSDYLNNAQSFIDWENDGSKTEYERLNAFVLDVLGQEDDILLSSTEMDEIMHIINDNENQLKKEA